MNEFGGLFYGPFVDQFGGPFFGSCGGPFIDAFRGLFNVYIFGITILKITS